MLAYSPSINLIMHITECITNAANTQDVIIINKIKNNIDIFITEGVEKGEQFISRINRDKLLTLDN